MSIRKKSDPATPDTRLEFARRLRELRVPKGFRTARSLARALDIDENRYTRYERAEVEPDLDMISRICQVLSITPNDLLGSNSESGDLAGAPEERATARGPELRPSPSVPSGGPTSDLGIASAAWDLAEAVAKLHLAPLATEAGAAAGRSPLDGVRETGRLYKTLMQRPFEAVSDLLLDPRLGQAAPESAVPLKTLIDRFVDRVRASRDEQAGSD